MRSGLALRPENMKGFVAGRKGSPAVGPQRDPPSLGIRMDFPGLGIRRKWPVVGADSVPNSGCDGPREGAMNG